MDEAIKILEARKELIVCDFEMSYDKRVRLAEIDVLLLCLKRAKDGLPIGLEINAASVDELRKE